MTHNRAALWMIGAIVSFTSMAIAGRALGQHRSTQRRLPKGRADEERLVVDMIELTRQYGRHGYRRVAALLRDAGWQVNDKLFQIEDFIIFDGHEVYKMDATPSRLHQNQKTK